MKLEARNWKISAPLLFADSHMIRARCFCCTVAWKCRTKYCTTFSRAFLEWFRALECFEIQQPTTSSTSIVRMIVNIYRHHEKNMRVKARSERRKKAKKIVYQSIYYCFSSQHTKKQRDWDESLNILSIPSRCLFRLLSLRVLWRGENLSVWKEY